MSYVDAQLKVLDVTEFYSERGGGVRNHLTLKAMHFARRGIVHRVLAPGPRDEVVPALADPAAPAAVRPLTLRLRGPGLPYDPSYHLLWRVPALRAIVRRERPSVLEINSPYIAALGSLAVPTAWYGIRTFFWHADFIDTYVRTLVAERCSERASDLVAAPLWAFVRSIGRACDATIVTSKTQADKLGEHGILRVRHVPLGVDTKLFTPARRSERLRHELIGSGRQDAIVSVGVGRFAVEKRWDVVLEAVERARAASGRDLILLLLGDGPEREKLARKASGASHVRFLGFEQSRERLADVLASADLLVHACPYETFGLGVAEAVSSGLPIVVPEAGGAFEIARGCARGDSAVTYAAGDARACAAAIQRSLERPRERVREAALGAARRAPSIDDHFDGVVDLYRELIARRSREKAA